MVTIHEKCSVCMNTACRDCNLVIYKHITNLSTFREDKFCVHIVRSHAGLSVTTVCHAIRHIMSTFPELHNELTQLSMKVAKWDTLLIMSLEAANRTTGVLLRRLPHLTQAHLSRTVATLSLILKHPQGQDCYSNTRGPRALKHNGVQFNHGKSPYLIWQWDW